jgi:hypothetical protein
LADKTAAKEHGLLRIKCFNSASWPSFIRTHRSYDGGDLGDFSYWKSGKMRVFSNQDLGLRKVDAERLVGRDERSHPLDFSGQLGERRCWM